MKPKFKFVKTFDVDCYSCGVKTGDRLKLKSDIVITCEKKPTGEIYPAGEIWTVLPGSSRDPNAVRLLQSDGKLHFWSNDDDLFLQFEVLKEK